MGVDASYNIYSMYALTCGTKVFPGAQDASNICDYNGIANPDNLSVMDNQDVLLIGEDTTVGHQNDYLWAYNFVDKSLTRILTTPYGSEVTSAYFYPNIKGFSYAMTVVQHPYIESDSALVTNPYSEGINAYIGYYTWKVSEINNANIKFAGIAVPVGNQTQSKVISSTSAQACRNFS